MAETPGNPNIDTGGGMANSGSISAGDNNFFGRDQITNIFQGAPAQIGGKPSLPRPPADFVGREAELDALCQSIEKDAINRAGVIITGLHGLGGIGKTALALKAAERLQPHYPDGGIYLDLHGPDPNPLSPEQALEHFIRVYYPAAKLPESLADLQVAYTQALSGKRLLLLLDNARDRAQVAPLLDALPPGCLALVTSRVHFYYPGMADQHLDVLPEDKAMQLLLEIAPRIGAQAESQPQAHALAKVCGYLPLALRVVASQLHVQLNLKPADVLDFMQDAVTRLEMTTLDASLELSYQMLPDPLREPWRKLGVFAGDFGEPAAARVWGLITDQTTEEDDQRALREAKQTLGELITYSLVEYKDNRYHLHDLARLFANGKLSAEEGDNARLIHAQYYYQILQGCNILYEQGNEKILAGLSLFDRERREISAGWAWTAGSLMEDAKNTAADAARRLWLCCYYPDAGVYVLSLRLHPRERIRWLEQALSAARRLNDREAEELHLGNLGTAYKNLGEAQQAIEYYEQSLVIAREMCNRRGEGTTLVNLGIAYADLGEVQRGIGYFEQGLAIAREIGNRRGEGAALGNLGTAYYDLGEVQRAIGYGEQVLAIMREIGDRRGECNALNNLGGVYSKLGEAQQAIEYYEQSLVIAREIGDRQKEGTALNNLGGTYKDLGEVQRAIGYYEQWLAIAREISDRRREGNALCSLGLAYDDLGEVRRAIGYYEQWLAIAREIGDRRGEGAALGNLGVAYYNLGEVPRAIGYYEQTLTIVREIGDRQGEATACWNLGIAYSKLGEVQQAIGYYEQQLVIVRKISDRQGEATVCWNLGLIRAQQDDLAGAVALMQVRVDYLRSLGHPDAEKHAALMTGIRIRGFLKSLFRRKK